MTVMSANEKSVVKENLLNLFPGLKKQNMLDIM